MQRAAVVGWVISSTNEARKSSLSSIFMSMNLKAYQSQKHCTELSNPLRQDFKTLERYHGEYYFIIHCDDGGGCIVSWKDKVIMISHLWDLINLKSFEYYGTHIVYSGHA